MRLVHLTASPFFGGPERQMLGLAKALPHEYDITFVSFAEAGRCEPFLSQVRRAGFTGLRLHSDTPRLFAARRELTDLLHVHDADLLLCHGYKANLVGRPAARRAGVPAWAVARGWTGQDFRVRCYDRLDRLLLCAWTWWSQFPTAWRRQCGPPECRPQKSASSAMPRETTLSATRTRLIGERWKQCFRILVSGSCCPPTD